MPRAANSREIVAENPAPPSKSQRKRAMHELQHLGEGLCSLDPTRLATLGLPEQLVDAIGLARRITAHEGRRRQMQYVGRLMRDIDAESVRAALESWARGDGAERARFALVERWRDRLLADPESIAEFVASHPNADAAALAALVSDIRAERTQGKPPHKSRALFRELKRILDASEG